MTAKNLNTRLARIESKLDQLRESAEKPYDLAAGAEYLRCSKSHLYKLTSTGKIAHYKPAGKRIFFDKRDLDEYLQQNRVDVVQG